jgi:tetratricopeptide (TPR) repeat protein
MIVAAYANSLHNAFHFDDSHVIENNIYLRNLGNLPRYFTDSNTFSSLPQNATYRPLVTVSLALDYARGALDPTPYHVTQIALLLILGVMLTVFFTRIVGPWAALFAAALFCLHTANTETMNLISARSELLSTLGLIGSFLLYQHSHFARRTFLYLVPLVIGALAKAPLVVFAPLLFSYAWLIEKKTPRDAARIALPSLVLGVGLLLFLNSMNSPQWKSGGGDAYHYVITQPFVWLHYARLFVLPIGLTADTDWTPFAHWYDTRAIAGFAFVALLVYLMKRARPSISFGIAWFVVALLPTSVFPLAEVSNEHRLFFAFIGLVLVAASVVTTRTAAVVAVALLIAHAVGTHQRNEVWKTEASLWADVVAKSPHNGRAWMNYGLTQMARGEYGAAKASFDRAAAFTPAYSYLEINQGVVAGQLGDGLEAERHFRRALQLNADGNAHFFFARWLVSAGRSLEATDHLRAAIELSPAASAQKGLLLRLVDARGNEGEKLRLMSEIERIDPNDPTLSDVRKSWPTYDAAYQAGLAALRQGDYLSAAHGFLDATRHDPRSADAHNNRGWALEKLGFRDEAIAAYEAAVTQNPAHERARNNLNVLRATQAPMLTPKS